jgi:hypothetical protein
VERRILCRLDGVTPDSLLIRNAKDNDQMVQPLPSSFAPTNVDALARNNAHSSGVSWAAVVAGAFVAAALSLALLALGTGIGFSAVSPLTTTGSAVRIGRTAIGWLILMELIASSAGGYLAGRLRSRWVHIHTHEVHFRDTAHGFLVWAVSLVITAAFLTSAATSFVGGVGRARIAAAAGPESSQLREDLGLNEYFVDQILRTTGTRAETDSPSLRDEVNVILANGLRLGSLPPTDRSYLSQIVARRTGASPLDAEKRVDEAFSDLQQTADAARRAIAHSMYWTFAALLIGAFSASLAATIGGKERDRVVVVS